MSYGAPTQQDDDNERFARQQALLSQQGNQSAQAAQIAAAAQVKLMEMSNAGALQREGDFGSKSARDFGLSGLETQRQFGVVDRQGKNQLGVMQAQMAPAMMGAQLDTKKYDDHRADGSPMRQFDATLGNYMNSQLGTLTGPPNAPSVPAAAGASTQKQDTREMDWNGPPKDVMPLDPRVDAARAALSGGGSPSGQGAERDKMRMIQSLVAMRSGNAAPNFAGQDVQNEEAQMMLQEKRQAMTSKRIQAMISTGDVAGATALAKQAGVPLPSTMDTTTSGELSQILPLVKSELETVSKFIRSNNWSIAGNQEELRALYDQTMNKVNALTPNPKTRALVEDQLKQTMRQALSENGLIFESAGSDATRRNFGLGGGNLSAPAAPQGSAGAFNPATVQYGT